MKNPSVLVYDIAGKGFTRFRGVVGLENPRSEIGSTLNPQIRFFVFDARSRTWIGCVPPRAGHAAAARRRRCSDGGEAIDRVFWHALGRAPSPAERARRGSGAARSGARRPSVRRGARRSAVGRD